MSATIRVERQGSVATVWIDNEAKRNAISLAMWKDIGRLFAQFTAGVGRDDLRCIVLRGAGAKAFGSGADIEEFEAVRATKAQGIEFGRHVHAAMAAVRDCPVPVLAAIRGICVGGGLELAAVCDLRICSADSRFAVPIARLGATLAYAELEGLYALAGKSVTLELLLEGRIFAADEAYQKGLVTRVVDNDSFDTQIEEAVARICAGAPLSARWHKKFLARLTSGAALTAADIDEGFACFDTEDFQIGYRTFLAKTPPAFTGR